MNDERLTEHLVRCVMGWKVGPDRFIKSGRTWIPKWRFQPMAELGDAFQLLDQAALPFSLRRTNQRVFVVEVQVGGRSVKASGEHIARTITTAVARALGIVV